MLPKTHILAGAIFSFLLWFFFPDIFTPLNATLVFLASFLIDVDHYLYYVYKTKQLGLKDSFLWFKRNSEKFKGMSKDRKAGIHTGLCFLHGIETIIILVLLSLLHFKFSDLFMFIVIGFIFHQVLDAIALYRCEYRFDKVISFIYAVYNSRDKLLLQEI